jgi:hypothetical protein
LPISITGANGEDQKLTLTLRLWLQNNLEDHFYGHNPLFKKLQLGKRIVKEGLGTKIVVPIKYPQAGGPQPAGVSDPYQSKSHSAMTGITSALYDWAEYTMPISVPERELKAQGSMTKKLGYMESVMDIGMDRFMDKLRQDVMAAENDPLSIGTTERLASLRTFFNKGGAATTGPTLPLPLASQLSASDALWGNAAAPTATTAQYVIGGINRNAAGNAYFCVPVKNPTTAQALDRTAVNQMITLGTRNSDKPDMLLVTQGHYDVLMGILQQQRQILDSKLTDYGFDAFQWRGCDVFWDDDIPIFNPGTNGYNMFAINSKALKLVSATEEPEVVQGAVDTERSIKTWRAQWFGQLVMTKMGRGAGARHANLLA